MRYLSMMMVIATAATLLTSALPEIETAHASPPDMFGYGPRSQGMAMTGTAFANDYEAVYSNVAGLSRAERIGFTLGFQLGHFDLQINDQRSPLASYNGLTIGFQLPLPFGGVLEDVLAVGAGFHSPNGSVLQTDIIFPDTAQWVVMSRAQSVHLQMGLGINLSKLIPGLRVGVGFAALANIGGRLSVFVNEADTFVTETETQLLASFSLTTGAQWDYGILSLGFAWHDEVVSDIALNVVTGLPIDLPVITITATPQYDPHLFAFEIAVRPIDGLLIAAHLDYRLWSRYGGVVGKSSAFSNLPPHPGFRNTVSPRIGIEYSAERRRTTGFVRGGYAFEMTPADAAGIRDRRDSEGNVLMENGEVQQQALRYIDNSRHIMTLGAGVTWRSPSEARIRLELFTQFHHLAPRTHEIGLTDEDTTAMRSDGWIFTGGWSFNLEW